MRRLIWIYAVKHSVFQFYIRVLTSFQAIICLKKKKEKKKKKKKKKKQTTNVIWNLAAKELKQMDKLSEEGVNSIKLFLLLFWKKVYS